MDVVDRKTRSRIMASVRSHSNKSTEWRLRALLVRAGIRQWRVRPDNIVGRPDFVFPDQKIAVFVDGCFWHGCPTCYRMPHTNQNYWKEKIRRNIQRDAEVTEQLQAQGWQVLRIWEHELRNSPIEVVAKIKAMVEVSTHS